MAARFASKLLAMRWVPLSILALALVSCRLPELAAPAGSPDGIRVVKITDSRLTESSGIAPSRTKPGVYYTHNDSGDSARFFAFTLDNPKLEEFDVENAEAKDWEDMGTATVRGKSYVYCGDIGDNASKRKTIHVYRVPEPNAGGGKVRADQDLELTYPDGPHNAEALLVQPGTGDITIVIKSQDKKSGVYSLPAPSKTGSYQLTKIGNVDLELALSPARLITGGAISADSKHLVLRTYLAAYEFDVPSRFNDWVRSKPRVVALNHDPQGEGITYRLDGKFLVTTSEGTPCPVSEIPLGR
jgi:hypothetical protein